MAVHNEAIREHVGKSKVTVLPGRYAYLKLKELVPIDGHFMMTQDEDEVTVVTEEAKVAGLDYEEREGDWWKLLEFRLSLPFVGVGFLATMATTIADVGHNALIVSTYSKDCMLVRESALEECLAALREVGFPVVE